MGMSLLQKLVERLMIIVSIQLYTKVKQKALDRIDLKILLIIKMVLYQILKFQKNSPVIRLICKIL